jgi:hypothetical protein
MPQIPGGGTPSSPAGIHSDHPAHSHCITNQAISALYLGATLLKIIKNGETRGCLLLLFSSFNLCNV